MQKAYCEALRTALEFEEAGAKLYESSINKVTSPFAKRVLEFLVKEEHEHIRKIEAFNASLLGKGEFDIAAECAIGVTSRIPELIKEYTKAEVEKVGPDSLDLDIYDMAMDMEKAGHEAYEKFLAEAQAANDELLERFFEFMVSEEEEHFDLLQASKKYLEDPAYYFLDYGGWIFVEGPY
jgi:rubrerythrin